MEQLSKKNNWVFRKTEYIRRRYIIMGLCFPQTFGVFLIAGNPDSINSKRASNLQGFHGTTGWGCQRCMPPNWGSQLIQTRLTSISKERDVDSIWRSQLWGCTCTITFYTVILLQLPKSHMFNWTCQEFHKKNQTHKHSKHVSEKRSSNLFFLHRFGGLDIGGPSFCARFSRFLCDPGGHSRNHPPSCWLILKIQHNMHQNHQI